MRISDDTIKIIKPIARKTRRWILKTIQKDCDTSTKNDTTGYCAIATAKLYELLTKEPRLRDCEITPTVIDNTWEGSHAFIIINNFIVDVTADQFKQSDERQVDKTRAIEIRTIKSAKRNWFWDTRIRKNNEDDIDKRVWRGIEEFLYTTEGWGEQSPQRYGLLEDN